MLPVFVELVRHQGVERAPIDAARHHIVHQPRKVPGQRQRRGRATNYQRRQYRPFGPGGDKSRQHQPAFEFAELGRDIQGRDTAGLGIFRERQLILVDIAERDDTRQDRRIMAEHFQKYLPRQPPGPPGRQIERRLRQVQRVVAGLEPIDQPAIDQSGDDGAQQRHGDGNAENAHGHPDLRSRANIGSDIGMVMGGLVASVRVPQSGPILRCMGLFS